MNIPPRAKPGRKRLYRVDLLEVGEALFIPLSGRTTNRIDRAHNSLRTAATQYARRYAPHASFEVRRVDGRVGCWRTR